MRQRLAPVKSVIPDTSESNPYPVSGYSFPLDDMSKDILRYMADNHDCQVPVVELRTYIADLNPGHSWDWFKDRVWARVRRFLNVGYLQRCSRGVYKITPAGVEFAQTGKIRVSVSRKFARVSDPSLNHGGDLVQDRHELRSLPLADRAGAFTIPVKSSPNPETLEVDSSTDYLNRSVRVIALITNQTDMEVLLRLVSAEYDRLGIPKLRP